MYKIAGALHSVALFIALFVQSPTTPLAAAWIPFHVAGCSILLATSCYKHKPLLWWTCVIWLIALSLTVFITRAEISYGIYFWFLMAMPSLAVCLRKEHLHFYTLAFGSIVILYASAVDLQMLLHVHVNRMEAGNMRTLHSWPVLDPNNGSAILSLGVISSIYGMVHVRKAWGWWLILFGAAMYATGGRMALAATAIVILMMFYDYWRPTPGKAPYYFVAAFMMGIAIGYIGLMITPEFFQSIEYRWKIWSATIRMIKENPWLGIGLGQFPYYYARMRTEIYTAGYFAHNDPLQFLAEMGMPLGGAFFLIPATMLWSMIKENLLPCLLFFAIFMDGCVEFLFYLPAVSLLMGLALAYAIANTKKMRYNRFNPEAFYDS